MNDYGCSEDDCWFCYPKTVNVIRTEDGKALAVRTVIRDYQSEGDKWSEALAGGRFIRALIQGDDEAHLWELYKNEAPEFFDEPFEEEIPEITVELWYLDFLLVLGGEA